MPNGPDRPPALTRADYARAERFLPWNVETLTFRMVVEPHWIGQSERFWYRVRTREGAEFVLVDPEAGTRRPVFDHVRLAAALSRVSGIAATHANLPFEEIELVHDGGAVQFDAHERRWELDLASSGVTEIERRPERAEGVLRSPDGRWEAFVREDYLWVRAVEEGEETRLTHDGEEGFDYASQPEGRTTAVTDRLTGKKLPPAAVWSPDSMRLLTHRLDQRRVRELHLVQAIPHEGGYRPALHRYRAPFPGDEELAQAHLLIIDMGSGIVTPLQADPLWWPYTFAPSERGYLGWSADSRHAWFISRERGLLASSLHAADATTGEVRQVFEERGRTLTVPHLSPTTDRPLVWLSKGANEALWLSQRDGWGHLYLVDAASGQIARQLTGGPWVARELLHVDEESRMVLFTAGGREAGSDPYARFLYRVSLDGGESLLLSEEEGDHAVTPSPSGRFLIDTYSSVDRAPVSVVRDAAGRVVVALEEGEIDGLLATGWRPPERVCLRGRDGAGEVWGVVVRPTNHDPARRYPVLDSIYPGPQRIQAPVGFPGTDTSPIAGFWAAQSLAELGFVVVMLDGLGMPFRSKAQHDFAYRNFQDGGGLPDHIAALRQLAARDPSLDLERVGIFGHSGGGYASVKAMLQHPDFYKAAVSSAGNHDQRGYMAEWGEMYLGHPDAAPDAWEAQSNFPLVDRLAGKLMLAWGEMDDNVHPALTIRLLDALIKAGKDVEVVVVPNANHAFADIGLKGKDTRGNNPNNLFFIRKRWDFFIRHLLGAEPPEGYVIGSA